MALPRVADRLAEGNAEFVTLTDSRVGSQFASSDLFRPTIQVISASPVKAMPLWLRKQ
jgi:hypothetical protein